MAAATYGHLLVSVESKANIDNRNSIYLGNDFMKTEQADIHCRVVNARSLPSAWANEETLVFTPSRPDALVSNVQLEFDMAPVYAGGALPVAGSGNYARYKQCCFANAIKSFQLVNTGTGQCIESLPGHWLHRSNRIYKEKAEQQDPRDILDLPPAERDALSRTGFTARLDIPFMFTLYPVQFFPLYASSTNIDIVVTLRSRNYLIEHNYPSGTSILPSASATTENFISAARCRWETRTPRASTLAAYSAKPWKYELKELVQQEEGVNGTTHQHEIKGGGFCEGIMFEFRDATTFGSTSNQYGYSMLKSNNIDSATISFIINSATVYGNVPAKWFRDCQRRYWDSPFDSEKDDEYIYAIPFSAYPGLLSTSGGLDLNVAQTMDIDFVFPTAQTGKMYWTYIRRNRVNKANGNFTRQFF